MKMRVNAAATVTMVVVDDDGGANGICFCVRMVNMRICM